ncbi:hypothetical protein F383_33649 [Gossypium arboreum]|uniref:Uncharacterized protein n=1 Tax=Gossypium arboreum TaxID=29729 RepID=A0A0B0PP50_GOSAR|nr:hypothetical protein F383_33649 [Gossypium arboreum]
MACIGLPYCRRSCTFRFYVSLDSHAKMA